MRYLSGFPRVLANGLGGRTCHQSERDADPDCALELTVETRRAQRRVRGRGVLQSIGRSGPDVADVESEQNRLGQTDFETTAVIESDVLRSASDPVRKARHGPKLGLEACRH